MRERFFIPEKNDFQANEPLGAFSDCLVAEPKSFYRFVFVSLFSNLDVAL